jgi:opacity protein-like surface antigen
MRRALVSLSLVLALVPVAAPGQRAALREVRSAGTAGGNLLIGIPQGEFQQYVKAAAGFGGFVNLNLDRSGATGMRLEGAFLIYDHLHDVAYLSGGYYSYPIGLTTSSYIASLRAGPQLTFGQGPLRLYGFGLGGVSYFATTTSFDDSCGCGSFASTTEWDDVALSWEAGGGMQLALGRGHNPVLLDLGARYLHNGRVTYVPAQTLAGGTLNPVASEANLVVLQLGVSVGLR